MRGNKTLLKYNFMKTNHCPMIREGIRFPVNIAMGHSDDKPLGYS